MKKRYIALIAALLLLLIALTGANLYIAANRDQITPVELERAVQQQNTVVKQTIRERVAEEVAKIVIPVLQDGKDGRDGKDGQDGTTTIIEHKIVETLPGIKGEKGDKGDAAPRPILLADPATGDLYYRYEDTTAWTLLMEACVLTKTCEE